MAVVINNTPGDLGSPDIDSDVEHSSPFGVLADSFTSLVVTGIQAWVPATGPARRMLKGT